MKNLSKDELKNISEKLSSQSIYSNNHKLVFRSKHYDHLIIGLSLAFANHSRARSYSIDPKLGLILYWLEDKGQYPLGPKSVSGPLKIPDGLGAFEVGEYVWDWLQKVKYEEYEEYPDLDGSVSEGFLIESGDFYKLSKDHFYIICSIKPSYLEHGK